MRWWKCPVRRRGPGKIDFFLRQTLIVPAASGGADLPFVAARPIPAGVMTIGSHGRRPTDHEMSLLSRGARGHSSPTGTPFRSRNARRHPKALMVMVGTDNRAWGISLRRPDVADRCLMAGFFRPPGKPAAAGVRRPEKDRLDERFHREQKRCGTAFEGRDARSSIPFGTGYASTIPRFAIILTQK